MDTAFKEKVRKDIAAKIRMGRAKKMIKHYELAKKLEISQSALHSWERAIKCPSVYRLKQLEEILDVVF